MSKFFRKAPRTVTRSWKHQTRSVHQWAKFKRFVADMPQDMLEFELEDLGCLDGNGYEDAHSSHLSYLMDFYNWENLDSYHDWVCMQECLENEELVAKLEHQYGIITHHHELLVRIENGYYKPNYWSCEDWDHAVFSPYVNDFWDDDDYDYDDRYQDLYHDYYGTPVGYGHMQDQKSPALSEENRYWQEIWNKIQPDILEVSRKEELRLLGFEILWNKAQAEVVQILEPQENEWLKKFHSQNSRLRKTIGPRAAKYL